MAGIGVIQILSPGPVTKPVTLTPDFLPGLGATFKGYQPSEVIFLPSLRAVLFCDGIDFQYHYRDGIQYLNGPLAPQSAPTVVGTGTRWAATLVLSGNPANGDKFQVGKPGAPGSGFVTMVTTIDTTQTFDQVKIGATAQDSADNIKSLINGTGVQGNTFWSYRMAQGATTTRWAEDNDVFVESSVVNVIFRAITYGTAGNAYLHDIVTGAWTFPPTFAVAGTHSQATFPGAGTYQHGYAYYRRGDFMQTGLSPTKETQNGDNSDMTVSGMAAAKAIGAITEFRVFRSTTNGGSQLYKEADTVSQPFTDFYNDTQISGDFANLYDPRLFRPYTAGYPTRFAHADLYRDCIFGVGAEVAGVYGHGVVNIVKGALTFTLVATNPLISDVIGRVLQINGFTDKYIIVDWNETTQVGTLNTPMLQTTNATAQYTITDLRDPTEIYWSSPGLYNNWPFGNSIQGVTTTDPAGVTALAAAFDGLVAFTRTGAWRIFGSPSAGFKIVPQGEGMGAFSGLSVARVEGVVLWLGVDGLWMWSNGSYPRSISSPDPTPKAKPRGIEETIRRINIDEADGIFSVYNPTERLVRWFVPLDGAPWNTHVITYDLQTGAFALDSCVPATYGATVVGPTGSYVTVVGDMAGNLWQFNTGLSDGVYGTEPNKIVSSYDPTTNTITVLTGGMPTDGSLNGCPLLHVVAATGEVQTAVIRSNTASTITLISPLPIAPVVTDTIILGGIEFRIQSSQYDFGQPEFEKTLSSVVVSFTPQPINKNPQLWVGGGGDGTAPTVFPLRSSGFADYANLARPNGQRVMHLRRGKYRRPQFELLALCPGFDVEVLTIVTNNPMGTETYV